MKNLITTFIVLLFSNLIFGQLPNYVSSNGLKAWYSFSGNANDQSITNNNLTNSGGVTFGADRFGNTNSAAIFDGSGQHFVKANPDIPSGSSDRTISFWYKEETNSETQPVLFSIDGNGTYPCQSTFTSYLNTSLAGYYLMGNCNDKSWGNSRQYNNWNHMVYVMKADTIYLYRNDTLLSNNFSYFHFSPSLNTIIAQFLIGDGYHAGGSSNPFKGAIDDFGIWDRALTRCEISSLNQAQNMPCRNTCMVAQYDFSGNANDVSGNANHGIVNGATLTTDRFGNSNSAYSFDGSNDYMLMPSGTTNNLNITNDYTISCWVKTTDPSALLVSFGDNFSGTQGYFSGIGAGGVPSGYFSCASSTGGWQNSNSEINDNVWRHLIYTLKSDTMRVYVDNTLTAQYLGINSPISYSGNRVIGCRNDLVMSSGSNFLGLFDELKIYNCALSSDEVDSIYQSERTNPAACLMAQYDFSGNANDVSGNANHGAVNGATLIPDRFGNSNAAYSFDGIDDHISLNNTIGNFGTNDFTISTWLLKYDTLIGGAVFGKRNSINDGNMLVIGSAPVYELSSGTGDYMANAYPYQVTNTWFHAVFVRTGLNIKVYVNGILVGDENSLSLHDFNNGALAEIGARYSGLSLWNLWNGAIDDMKIFGCALTNLDIDSIYQAERTNNPQGCLVAQYNLNGNANDVSGYANHGVINGCIANTDRFGNVNGSLHFDGVNDFIEVPSSASLNLSNTMTFNTWFISHDPFLIGQTLIGRQQDATNKGINLSYDNISGKIELEDGVNFESATASFGGYHMGKWHMLTATHDGTDTKIYIDGVLKTTEPGAINLPVMTEPFNFGREGGFLLNYLHGDLDDIKIYNCALSAADIDSIFIAESPYEPCGFIVSAITTPPTCHDGNNGSINLSVSGSQPPYAFYWNNNQNTEDLSNLIQGNYSIIINDDNGCDTMITYNVFNPVSMDISLNITNPSCGMNNGNAIATVLNGGTGPFDYQWSSGDTLATADSLSAGIYMLTVTDPIGCTAAETFGVNNSGGLSLSAIVTDASCEGIFDGDINLIVSGGTSPFTYSWSDASTNEDLTNVSSGAYMVEVTDDNGCVAVLNTTIGSSSIDLSNVNITDPSCGNTDGSISLNPTGGTAPYDYLWSSNAGSATTSSVSSLGAGTYFVTVTDDNGCAETEMLSLSNTNGPSVVLISVSSADCGGAGGNINIGITSGISPFTYEWSNGETTQDISDLNLGTYSVDVTDDDGCVTSLSVNVPGVTLDPITLCMSTVNDINGKVLCLWQKPAVDYISHFNIYRENSVAGQYDFILTRPYDSTSQWTDLTANPQTRGWRYKVTYVDTCGNESPFGINHKTIHVTANLGVGNVVNLIWDDYEGFNFPTFYIERYHPSTGWETIDSIPSTLHSYTDAFPPNGNLQYAINIKSPTTCDPTRVGVNTSRSNVRNQPTAMNDIDENESILSLNLYPNPASNELIVSLENYSGGDFNLKIFNAIGELILIQKINSNTQRIDTKEIPSGFYTLEVSNEINSFVKKLVIQK